MSQRDDFAVIDVSGLSTDEVALLHDDVWAIYGEETATFEAAERVLLGRIGGQKNVKDYIACLAVGKARRDARDREGR